MNGIQIQSKDDIVAAPPDHVNRLVLAGFARL
jgi:hypothetical protein